MRTRGLAPDAGVGILVEVSAGVQSTPGTVRPPTVRVKLRSRTPRSVDQAPYSDWVRNEVGIATMTVGAVTSADQVNTLLAAGKADLVALGRPHLANPYLTLQAAAWYQHAKQFWPPQYLAGRDQALRNAPRERDELTELRLRARPASHEVKDGR